MPLFSWLHKQMVGRPHTRCTSAGKPRTSFRPRLEVLEGREVPSTLTVTNLGDGVKGSLRYEIAQAQGGDTIVFNKKLDGGTIWLSSETELYIGKNLTIQGPGAGLLAVAGWGGVQGSRVFEVGFTATVALSGLTIKDGGGYAAGAGVGSGGAYGGGDGGAILNHGALTISGCTLTGDSAVAPPDSAAFGNPGSEGGAVYSTGVLAVNGCTLSNNSAEYGGGIYNAGTATVSGCTLTGNRAVQGAGIYNAGFASALTILDSIFSSNHPDNVYGPYTDGGGNTFH